MPPVDPESLASSLRRLATGPEHDVTAAIDEAVRACAALFSVSGGGLMIVDENSTLHYVAASDERGHVLEKAQSATGTGPCVEAFVRDEVVVANDLRSDPRWPEVTPVLTREGVLAVLGCPLRLGGVPVGTLDVYRNEPHTWDESERTALIRYSEVIEAMLSTALNAQRAGELAGQLQYALDYRVVIERAVGYLMAQHRVDSVTAFNVLRSTARDQRRKVADVAQELLDTGTITRR
ncbi:hypothetical protein Aab01nite_84640 [Paractinoplanes abujensis]|uniref:Transcriptional regulator with GAF, ATPase, and Fis domain n=1 Tax=Paractinoplanes abujensis TaxID=882441 RepID=A0A7W7CR23_9ACTN|nr:GAF and ANTAR domain-containing protein [Actinoplanes abujensis]MBB4693088.1 transcriptional regulator with GAF, ATPase, and Fis domain [Actinoplanes abujensis]GID24874.1 hypothetical protein Aab01nite_84640 [Actinoplanes abujensis]